MPNAEIEQEIQQKNLNAPRVTPENLHAAIESVEIVKFVTQKGQTLRWAVLNMKNGFAVVGDPSCSVSPENDDEELGERIAIQNSQRAVWPLEGYALKQKLYAESLK